MVDASRFIEALSAMVGAAFVQSMTPMAAYHVDGRAPWAVVAPGDIDQVAGVLMLAHREALAVVPWGGGTTMAMGHPPERLDIVLSLQRLSRVLEHEPADLTATVQAGITMADLRRQLGSRGQWWPVDAGWSAGDQHQWPEALAVRHRARPPHRYHSGACRWSDLESRREGREECYWL